MRNPFPHRAAAGTHTISNVLITLSHCPIVAGLAPTADLALLCMSGKIQSARGVPNIYRHTEVSDREAFFMHRMHNAKDPRARNANLPSSRQNVQIVRLKVHLNALRC